jgi:hypothetical protein
MTTESPLSDPLKLSFTQTANPAGDVLQPTSLEVAMARAQLEVSQERPLESGITSFRFKVQDLNARQPWSSAGSSTVQPAKVLNISGKGFLLRRCGTDPGVRLDVVLGNGEVIRGVVPGNFYRVSFSKLMVWRATADRDPRGEARNDWSASSGDVEILTFASERDYIVEEESGDRYGLASSESTYAGGASASLSALSVDGLGKGQALAATTNAPTASTIGQSLKGVTRYQVVLRCKDGETFTAGTGEVRLHWKDPDLGAYAVFQNVAYVIDKAAQVIVFPAEEVGIPLGEIYPELYSIAASGAGTHAEVFVRAYGRR